MKTTKKILSILLSCLMLLSMLTLSVFAAEGDQANPINANDKWFGYGVDCFLMNTTLEANDADGVWYQLTADKAGILHVEHSSTAVEYQITVNVNGKEYLGHENGVYNKPVVTLPVAVGDVISIHIIAQDTTLGGLVYCSAKFITGENNINEMVKLKGANVKIWIAADTTLYLQDDSLQAEYAAMGLKLESSVNGEGITVISASKNYTDTDGDGYIELKLAGSAGSAGVPPVKPAFAIENLSGQDAWFILNVTESTAHECVYDNDTDADCNSCGAVRELACNHTYTDNCDADCDLCGEGRVAPHYAHPCVSGCTICGAETPVTADHVDEDGDDACDICNSWASCGKGKHQYINACDTHCHACKELTRPDAKCESDAAYPCQDGLCKYCCVTEMPATGAHEYFYPCDPVCMHCYEVTNPDAAHKMTFTPAKDATCSENGNIAYYSCEYCGGCWDNEQAMGMPLNRFMVIIPATGEHVYNTPFDPQCIQCQQNNPNSATEYMNAVGTAISEDVNGLAVLYEVKVDGMELDGTKAVYDNATIGGYKLVSMGAVVSNNYAELGHVPNLDDVDGVRVINVPAVYLCDVNEEAGTVSFAIRVINIPDEYKNREIDFLSYFIYEDAEGNQHVQYANSTYNAYNEFLN